MDEVLLVRLGAEEALETEIGQQVEKPQFILQQVCPLLGQQVRKRASRRISPKMRKYLSLGSIPSTKSES